MGRTLEAGSYNKISGRSYRKRLARFKGMKDRDFEVSMEVVPAKDGAVDGCTWVNPPYCRKCGGRYHPSKALVNLMCGTRDVDGSMQLGMSKDVEMVDCLKCGICGHSFVLGKDSKLNKA